VRCIDGGIQELTPVRYGATTRIVPISVVPLPFFHIFFSRNPGR
jgi:hypothetical protein